MKKVKKSIIHSVAVASLLLLGCVSFSACGSTNIDLNNSLIEKRNNLFVASDSLYTANFSTGMHEENYDFDGTVGNMVEFGVITFYRNDMITMTNDTYTYIINIGDQQFTGFLTKSPYDNTCTADIGHIANDDAEINLQISFTGYKFSQDMENISSAFQVDSDTAITIANKELKDGLKNIASDKNVKIETVMKILKDYSTPELKKYYWYVGVISTNGETIGVLIDANTGDIISKKI